MFNPNDNFCAVFLVLGIICGVVVSVNGKGIMTDMVLNALNAIIEGDN